MPTEVIPPSLEQAETQVRSRILSVLERERSSGRPLRAIYYAVLLLISLSGLLLLTTIPLFIYSRLSLRNRRRWIREMVEVARRARLSVAYPLMVNRQLLAAGTEGAPGLFLVSPDPATANDLPFNFDLVGRISTPASPPMSDQDVEFCDDLFMDEQFTPLRLRALPESITGGRRVFAADLVIDPLLLHGTSISDENLFLPCLFDEESRMTIILPPWLITGQQATPQDQHILARNLMLQWKLKEDAATTS